MKVKVHSSGKMAESTKVNGKMENNTELVYLHPKITRLKEGSGRMERRFAG